MRGLGRLGTVDTRAAEEMLLAAQPAQVALDQVVALLRQADREGALDPVQLATWADRRDELLASYERLVNAASTAAGGNGDTRQAWLDEAARLQLEAMQLAQEIGGQAAAQASSKVVSVAFWTGAAVLGVVGTLLTVKWYRSRRRR